MIKVLVADDHELVRCGIRRLIDDVRDIKVVAEAANGEEAVKLARKHRPHVVLLDVRMPGMNGIEATRKMMRFDPDLRIIAISASIEEPIPSKLLQAGASGFLTKGAGVEEMERAIRSVLTGKRFLSPAVAEMLALKVVALDEDRPFEHLSDREMQVLIMVTSGEKIQDISDQLCLSPKTINSYRYRLFDKLGVTNDVEMTHLALKHCLVDNKNYV
ncbi:UvrY/SirA/GacA family response regulator transcription factor [Pelagibaculum spongiae]|uniref:Two-component system response regulator UvrY n=1 Tax=Pelagibaculum spongiae TaxID=2080658 RepID=A0A2V1GWK8_9GAMM|nr:UvrY/SirA/GacA family response regulator transcription factor [Pelagibaculum spongiae]PVZ69057.1 two-component system response regulator UvrY [Pelagibaculum spongiae]